MTVSALPSGLAPRIVAFCDELRREGVAVGTAEILDAFAALDQVPWTVEPDFREALAATVAKSQDDRRVFDLVFDRFFFRAAEAEALAQGITEQRRYGGSERLDLAELRDAIRQAIGAGRDGEMRDLARLAVAAFGQRGEGSGVIGVDVQRIRRALGLVTRAAERGDEPALDREGIGRFERHLRRELERGAIERTERLPPARPLAELIEDDLDPRSTLIVLGDARTNGREPHAQAFGRIAARAGRTFWLNPEPRLYWNYGDSVMAAYEPHCTAAFECWTTRHLEGFVNVVAGGTSFPAA